MKVRTEQQTAIHISTRRIFLYEFEFKMPTKSSSAAMRRTAWPRSCARVRRERVIVCGGGSVVRSGLLSRIECQLTSAGLAFQVLGGVQPDARRRSCAGRPPALAFKANFITSPSVAAASSTRPRPSPTAWPAFQHGRLGFLERPCQTRKEPCPSVSVLTARRCGQRDEAIPAVPDE